MNKLTPLWLQFTGKMVRNLGVVIFGLTLFVGAANAMQAGNGRSMFLDGNEGAVVAGSVVGVDSLNIEMIEFARARNWFDSLHAINNGADINYVDVNGSVVFFELLGQDTETSINDLLRMAAINDLWNVVRVLLTYSIDVERPYPDINAQGDADGMTVLHISIDGGMVDLVEFLLVRGAGVNIRNQNGQTPLDLAYVGGYVQITHLLLSYDAIPALADYSVPIAPCRGNAAIARKQRSQVIRRMVTDVAKYGVEVERDGVVDRVPASLIILCSRVIGQDRVRTRAALENGDVINDAKYFINKHRF